MRDSMYRTFTPWSLQCSVGEKSTMGSSSCMRQMESQRKQKKAVFSVGNKKETGSVVHDTSKEFSHMLHEQLQELAMILTKKYHYSFSTEFFDDYRGSSNQKESFKMGQTKKRLGDRGLSNVVEEFNKIKQVGSVMEYQLRFEELMALMLNHNPYLTESYFVSSFLIGLNEELKPMVTVLQPKTLKHAVDSAKLQELTLKVLKKKQRDRDADGTWDQANPIKGPEQSYIGSTKTDPKADELGLTVRKKLEVEKRHSFDEILVLKHAELSLTWDKIGNEKVKTTPVGGKLRDIAEEAKGFAEGNTIFAVVLFFTSIGKSKLLSTAWRDELLAGIEVATTPNANAHKQSWYEYPRQICNPPLLHFEDAVDIFQCATMVHHGGVGTIVVSIELELYQIAPIEVLGQLRLGLILDA